MQNKLQNLTPQQLKRYEKLARLADSGELAIVDFLFEIEDKFDETLVKVESKVEELKNTVAPNLNNILEQIKGKDGMNGTQGEQGLKGDKGDKGDRGDDGKDGKNGKDGRDGRDGRDGLDGINGIDGNIKDLAPQEVRDLLELLKGDERLDISAIKGIGKSNSKLSDDIINRAIGIVDQRTSFLIQKVSNLKTQVDNINITSTGGGMTPITLTGLVNGSNTIFTCAIEPSIVNIDGLLKPNVSQNTPTETYWSWSAGTLTIDSNSTPYQFIIPLR